jgi:hypothetical protein
MEQKTFYKTLEEFSLYPNKAKKCLSDKRLTLTEKKVLEGHLLVRNNQNQKAIDLIKSTGPSEFPFVESQRLLILGLAHNNLSHYAEAEKLILESLINLEAFCAHYFRFAAYYNLFTIKSNLVQTDEMLKYIDLMESVPISFPIQEIRILKCRFDYSVEINDFENAEKVLEQIEPQKAQMVESDIISFLICEFMYHVKKEDFSQSEKTLQEMKSCRKFHLSENYNFMKKLLDHLRSNAPVYAYEEDFKEVPQLLYQLKVIQGFESGDQAMAKKSWKHLQEISSTLYKDDFYYCGTKGLFSLCLDKYLKVKPIEPVDFNEGSKLEGLVKLLQNAKAPLSKGYIYETLWGEEPIEKSDFNKLTRLIYKARVEYSLDIQTRKGTYFIESNPNMKKASGT